MMKVMQAMSLSRIQVATPEADPGTELIAVEEDSNYSGADLVQSLSCLVEGIILNRTWFGVLGFVSWPRHLFPSLKEN